MGKRELQDAEERFGRNRFHQVAGRSCIDGVLDSVRIGEGREHHDARAKLPQDLFGRLDAAYAVLELYIHQYEIRPLPQYHIYRFSAAGDFSNHPKPVQAQRFTKL